MFPLKGDHFLLFGKEEAAAALCPLKALQAKGKHKASPFIYMEPVDFNRTSALFSELICGSFTTRAWQY